MRAFTAIAVAVLTIAGCAKKEAVLPPVGVGGVAAQFGDYRAEEVARVSADLAKLRFPVAEGTIAHLLPRPLMPLPVRFEDGFVADSKGRIGGNVVEYWLNRDQVLRLTTGYYTEGEKHFSLEESVVLLTREEYERRPSRI